MERGIRLLKKYFQKNGGEPIKHMRIITVGHLEFGLEEREAVLRVLDSGRISEGDITREFENRWADFIGSKYCVATSSGTASLITVLTAFKYLYGFEKRRKVITSPLTYISDANALMLTGFEPIFVDIDPVTFCITPESIKTHLDSVDDPSTYSIILPVDLIGYSVRLPEIKKIARDYNLYVIEDAAEAHGTFSNSKKCGSDADAGIFSFYIAHNLSAGEMGAITTDNYEIYHMSKKIKSNGRFCKCAVCTRHTEGCSALNEQKDKGQDLDPRFLHDVIGYNFKTMEFQSAIALSQLNKVNEIIKKRQDNVMYLNDGLESLSKYLQLPLYDKDVSYLAYPVVIKRPDIISRRLLRLTLEKERIESRPLFGCIPTQQPAYHNFRDRYLGKLPNAEYVGTNGFYIGCHQYLTREDLDRIISVFNKIFNDYNE